MRLTNLGGKGYGSNYTPYTIEQLSPIENSGLTYKRWLHTYTREPYKEEEDKSPKLEVSWNVRVFYKGAAMYNFHTSQSFNVVERETPVTSAYLMQIAEATFKHAQKSFDDDRKEFPVFTPLADLSSEETDEAVQHLQDTLGRLQVPQTL